MSKRNFPDKFTVEVTEDDIKNGKKGDSRTCAIARGAKRTLKTNKMFDVEDSGEINIYPSNENSIRYLPTALKKAKTFIERFDTGKKVKPTTFTFVKVK